MVDARGVLWDLDGTLIDSAGYHWTAWSETLAAEGRGVTPEVFARLFGKRNDEILSELFGPEVTAAWMERVSETKEAAYRGLLRAHGLAPLPGALAWLARLHRAGWKQAIASSAPQANLDAVLEAIDFAPHLEAAVSADRVGRGKPDPAIFLESARQIGVTPARCVVVEDAPAGIEAARRAGMRSVGVLSAHHAELAADLVVPSLEALADDAFEALLHD